MSSQVDNFETEPDILRDTDNNGEYELRTEEVQEILSYIPHWIIRWGISILFLTIIILFCASWIIEYPDIITSRVTLTTQNPPASVVAQASGKLTKLFVEENEYVEANHYLAAIENPAEIQKVFALKKQLQSFAPFIIKPDEWVRFDLQNMVLGELQIFYSDFIQNHRNYKRLMETNYYANKIKSIEAQIISYKSLHRKLVRQKEILAKEMTLAHKKYENNKILFEKRLISENELRNSESRYLQKKYALENAATAIIRNDIQLSESQKTIIELNHQHREKENALASALQESFKKLQSQLAIWEQKYLLKAPTEGYVSFFKYWSDNQYVHIGDEVMTVVPKSKDIVGKAYLPGYGSGKVKIGQKVNIKFDNYPYNEFGVVTGRIASISLVAHDNQYLIDVRLPDGLQTSYDKTLEFKQEMQGTADIITDELRLFERIFNKLRYIFSSST